MRNLIMASILSLTVWCATPAASHAQYPVTTYNNGVVYGVSPYQGIYGGYYSRPNYNTYYPQYGGGIYRTYNNYPYVNRGYYSRNYGYTGARYGYRGGNYRGYNGFRFR